jgi:hypothetical protein
MRNLKFILVGLLLSLGGEASAQYLSTPIFGAAWDDLRFPATKIKLGASNPPAERFWLDDGAGSPGIMVLEFEDQAVAGNEEQVWYIAQMPHSWWPATSVDPHVHWHLEDTTSCNVRWCKEIAISDIDTAWPANTTITCADCPSGGTTNEQLCDIFPSLMSMSGYKISALVSVRMFRNSSHANDTCDAKDALFETADIHFRLKRPGSRQETVE